MAIVLTWIGWTLAALLAAVLLILVAALTSRVAASGRVGPGGYAATGRWGWIGVAVDSAEDRLVLRLAGIRIVRRRLSGAGEDASAPRATSTPSEDEEPGDAPKARRGQRLPLSSYRRLARTGVRELRRMARHVHVDRLHADLVVASDDPAWTGEAFAFACAARAWLRAAWPTATIDVTVDFVSTRPRGSAEGAAHLRPVRFLPGATRLAWAYAMERRRSRRRIGRRARSPAGKGRRAWWRRSSSTA
jgi:hypothetical protein